MNYIQSLSNNQYDILKFMEVNHGTITMDGLIVTVGDEKMTIKPWDYVIKNNDGTFKVCGVKEFSLLLFRDIDDEWSSE